MTRLTFPTYLDHLRSESTRFREVLGACDPAARVPTCPEWDAGDLLWHLGEVQWFWSTVIRTRPLAPDDHGVAAPTRPDSWAGLLDFYDTASHDLVAQLGAADPAERAWSWAPEQTVGFTFRRQAHEALIHRLDAEQTAGVTPLPMDPALATDGVAELLEVMYGGEPLAWATFTPVAGPVRVDVTDTATSLWVQPGELVGTEPESGTSYDGPHLVLVDDPDGEPTAVVSSPSGELDAYLWKRSGQGPITAGDPAAIAAFAAATGEPIT